MKKYTFAIYEGKPIVLLTQQWATAWIASYITKTGLVKPVNHYVFEQDIESIIEPLKIKDSELERLKIYHQDFVDYYNSLNIKETIKHKVFNYNEFLTEKYRKDFNDYAVGDIVMIRYNLTGDLCPVKIIAKKTHNYFIVSHKVEDSHVFNAPDHGIKVSEIIGRHRGVGDPINTTDRKSENPTLQPTTGGLIPGGDSWSNDITI